MDYLGRVTIKNTIVEDSKVSANSIKFVDQTELKKSNVEKNIKKDDTSEIKDNLKKVGDATAVVEIFDSEKSISFDITKKKLSSEKNVNIKDIKATIETKEKESIETTFTAQVDSTEDINNLKKELTEFTNQYSDLNELSNTLKNIQSGSDGKLTIYNLQTLNRVYKTVMEKIESGTLKVSDEVKNKFKQLGVLSQKVESISIKHTESVYALNQEEHRLAETTKLTLEKLTELKKNGLNDTVSKAITQMLTTYETLVESGDKEKVALYSLYLTSVRHTLSEDLSNMSPEKRNQYILNSLKSAENTYNEMANILNKSKTSGLSNPSQSKAQLIANLDKFKNVYDYDFEKTKNILSSYFDNIPKNNTNTVNSNIPNNNQLKPVSRTAVSNTNSTLPLMVSNQVGVAVNPDNATYVKLDNSNLFQNLTEQDVKEFKENDKKFHVIDELNNVTTQSSSFLTAVNNVVESKKELNKALSEVESFLKENNDLSDILASEIKDEMVDLLSKIKKDTELLNSHKNNDVSDDTLQKLIYEADKLENKMNLNIDSESASIVNLLVKFRAILGELDTEMKKLVEKNLINKIIDDSFIKFITENKQNIKRLDEAKKEINKIFKSSKEVMNSTLPYEIKQLTTQDALKKLSLVALYYNS